MIDREVLDEIIEKNRKENWWKPDLFVANVLPLLPKELEIISIPPTEDCNYNCFMYALGLSEDSEIVKDSNGFIYDTFFHKLVELGEIILANEQREGVLVTYEQMDYPNLLTHVAVIEKDAVVSKWSWGPIIRHQLLDVPYSYGSNLHYYEPIGKSNIADLYWKYKEFNIKRV